MSDNDTDFTITADLKIAGAVSYWRLSGGTPLGALRGAWVEQGLDTTLLPEPPSDETVLRRALNEVASKRRLVRPLKTRGSFLVVDEIPVGEDRLDWQPVMQVEMSDGGSPSFHGMGGGDYYELRDKIRDDFSRLRGELSPADVSAWLVKLAEQVTSTSLRDSGGVYFVPKDGMDFWRKAAVAIQSASAHRIYKIPAVRNEECVEAVLDAVVVETINEMDALTRELQDDDADMGTRALRTRAGRLSMLETKVNAYEAMLHVKGESGASEVKAKLDNLRERLGGLQGMVTAAILVAEDARLQAEAA
jgi:BMFP domain-containing protein YqiC